MRREARAALVARLSCGSGFGEPSGRAQRGMRIGKLALAAALGAFVVGTVDRDGIAWADTAGGIEGVVKDNASGDPLAGVTVIVTSPAMKRTETAITDENGRYKLTGLPTGTYHV